MTCGELLSKTKGHSSCSLRKTAPPKKTPNTNPKITERQVHPTARSLGAFRPKIHPNQCQIHPKVLSWPISGKSNLNSIHGRFSAACSVGFPKQRGFIPRRFYPADDRFRKHLAVP